MQYVIAFLEGIITFISPCLLPMLPIYISYFAGGGERTTSRSLKGALGFVTGFTVVFVTLGALAGTVGRFLQEYQTVVNMISGLVVIVFGLSFLGVFKLNLFKGSHRSVNTDNMVFFSALLFGVIFSISWMPCVGAFLGSALMLASQQAHAGEGMLMLLAYSLGLGIPFVMTIPTRNTRGTKRDEKERCKHTGGYLVEYRRGCSHTTEHGSLSRLSVLLD